MSKPSRGELLSRVERLERTGEAFQGEFHGMRKDLETMSGAVARMETKMDMLTQARRDETTAQKGKWSDTATTVAAIVTAVALVLGGIIWLIRATTDMSAVHQQQRDTTSIVMPQVSPTK